MKQKISIKIRTLVAHRANYECEYCKLPELFSSTYFQIDHIISIKHGGESKLSNLAYTCPHCNQHKGTDISFINALMEPFEPIRLYNLRLDIWKEHFEDCDGEILGISNIGMALQDF